MGERDRDDIGGSRGGDTARTGGAEHRSMGEGGAEVPTGAGQGDDSEPVEAGAANAAGAGGADAGSPGGMGGVRGGMSNPDDRPNGGVSPIQGDVDNDRH